MSSSTDITRYQWEIVRFVRESEGPQTTAAIHDYLKDNFGLTRDERTVQRWLKQIRENAEHPFHGFLRIRNVSGAEVDAGVSTSKKAIVAEAVGEAGGARRKPVPSTEVAESAPGMLMKELSVEEAWLLIQAERVLDKIIPDDFLDNSLFSIFRAARAVLDTDPAMKMLARRIVYVPRGHRLHEAPEVTTGRIEAVREILQAIRQGRMLAFLYKGEPEERQVHPIALVYREPKLYLKAMRDDRDDPTDYLVARMSEVAVLEDRPNRIPADYPIDPDAVDLSMHTKFGLGPEPVRLELHVDGKGRPNLIDDLQKFPIDPKQAMEPLGDDQWRLVVPRIVVTAQLLEWIVGRQGAVSVVSPAQLRVGN